MSEQHPQPFDRARLRLKPLSQRKHDLDLSIVMPLTHKPQSPPPPHLDAAAAAAAAASRNRRPVILMMGAHPLRRGAGDMIANLVRRNVITHIATNGACAIHDFEFSLIGATTESVARYIEEGQFGLWEETGRINDAVNSADSNLGYGRIIAEHISRSGYPHKDRSLFSACYEAGVAPTVHIGIGYDIIHEHPSFDAAAAGRASYLDFLIFAQALMGLNGGVVLNMGSAVMGPEVFLKALAMARNVKAAQGESIQDFTTAVFDIMDIPGDYSREPDKSSHHYYMRWWKTLLVRTLGSKGRSFFISGDFRETVPHFYHAVIRHIG